MDNNTKPIAAAVEKAPIRPSWDLWEPLFRLFILMVGALILALAIKEDLIFSAYTPLAGEEGIQPIRYILLVSSIIFLASVIFRTYLWFRYRTFDVNRVSGWPQITVIVPAYNEGKTVYDTTVSIVENDYPQENIKIILVDDGSIDDTHGYMMMAKERYPETVQIIRFPINQGKRIAIHEAYKISTSPFILTIDSDTRLDSHGIKEILTPMLLDARIGAVVGRIRVWNVTHSIFTRMLNAHFAMAFDFTRAVQSTFQNVFCLAGAFSAYRKSVLDTIIHRWLGQTFLNRRCTYGEDRSLTNNILRIGYGTYYQRSATAFTMVPTRLVKILKMLTRWARSNIRESIIFSQFAFNQNRRGKRLLPFIEFFSTYSLLVLHIIGFYWLFFSGVLSGNIMLRVLVYSVLFGFFYCLYYMRIEGGRDFPYLLLFSLFSSVFMIWIFTVAGLTLVKQGWSTR